uniref:Uncharacterized protein n=1 Tax=Toxoplasma gondii COUG TaxID=1074873 RepID=A0A2G8XQU9_TOXGO|nr:hypothetical protein TGCOUG_395380 [Toxoplasma gondii COUG]
MSATSVATPRKGGRTAHARGVHTPKLHSAVDLTQLIGNRQVDNVYLIGKEARKWEKNPRRERRCVARRYFEREQRRDGREIRGSVNCRTADETHPEEHIRCAQTRRVSGFCGGEAPSSPAIQANSYLAAPLSTATSIKQATEEK